MSSDRQKQQLPVLPITAMERQGLRLENKKREGVKQEHRTADDDKSNLPKKTKQKTMRVERR